MARKRYSAEQIIGYLREVEVLLANGSTIGQVCRKIGITEQTYYRWRRDHESLSVDQAKRRFLKNSLRENDYGWMMVLVFAWDLSSRIMCGVWLCGYPDRGWATFTHIDTDWWVYEGMPDSQGGSPIMIAGCIRTARLPVYLSRTARIHSFG